MSKDKQSVENQYKELIESNSNGIVIYKGEDIIFANNSCQRLTGYTHKEILSLKFWELAYNQEIVKERGLKRQNGENVISQYEEQVKRKDGSYIWVEFSAKKIIWNGEPAVMGSFYDISKQKEIEHQLLESERRYKALANITNEAIFFSHNGIGIDCNKTAERMFGYSRDEIIGMKGTTIVPDEYKPLIIERILSNYTKPYEVTGIRKNGTKFPIEIQGSQIIYNGKSTRVTIVRDISKQKESERNFLKSENKYKILTESITDCVFMLDPKGRFTYLSPAFTKITKYEIADFIGRSFLDGIAKEYHQKITKIFKTGLKEYKNNLYEIDIIGKGNIRIPTEISSSTLLDENNQPIGRIGTFRDITERKRNREALIIAKERAEQSDQLKTAFLQNMSHEIRTPLNGIIGFADLLQEHHVSEKFVHRYSSIIQTSGQRLLELINNILDISKIESGSIIVENKPFILNNLLKDIHNLLKLKAEEKGIKLRLKSELKDSESLIISDGGKLNQILLNLINNAIKFTEHGEVIFSYTLQGKHLRFFVKDTGTGINEAQQKEIFNRFFQTISSHYRGIEGAGLGLAITKGLVEVLGGEIDVKSKIGEGSEFFFTIPFRTGVIDNNNTSKDTIKINNEHLNILVAEDDETSFLFIEALLLQSNTNISHVSNGSDAIDFCENNEVDLVLMDINMPKMDGLEATKILKMINPNLPIIIQSAYAFSTEKDIAFKAGCNAFISKPIVKKELFKTINQLI